MFDTFMGTVHDNQNFKRYFRIWLVVGAVVFCTMLTTNVAAAATATWTGLGGGGTDPAWSNPVNWDIGGGGPGPLSPGDDLVFPPAPFIFSFNDLAPGFPVNTITLTGNAYIITGLPILLISGITDSSVLGPPNDVNLALTLGGNQDFTVDSSNLIISGGIDLSSATLNLNTTGSLDITSVISNISEDGGITKSGSGAVYLSGAGANTYSVKTVVNDGELILNKSGVIAIPGSLTIGDTVGANDSALVQESSSDQIADTSDISTNSDGKLDLNGNDDSIGALTMAGGEIATGAGTVTLGGDVTAGSTIGGLAVITGKLSLGGATRTFNITGGDSSPDLFITANISDGPSSAGIIVNGIEIGLSGTNTYTGTTTVNAGGLINLQSDNGLGAVSAGTEVMAGGTLGMVGSRTIGSEPLTLSGTGATFGAALFINGNSSWGGNITLNADSTMRVHGVTDTLILNGDISGSGLTKIGAGSLTLVGSNTYATTDIDVGTLIAGATNTLPSTTFLATAPGTIFNLNGYNQTVGSIEGAGNISLGSAILTTGGSNDSSTYSGIISGTGGLSKMGTGALTLPSNNTYTGDTSINGGTLIVNGSQPGSNVTMVAGSTLKGTGTVGTINSTGGVIAPGLSPGKLNSGATTLNASTNLNVELNGTTLGSSYDQLNASGIVTLGNSSLTGTLGFSSNFLDTFTIIQSTTPIVGTFAGLPENSVLPFGGKQFRINYNPAAHPNGVTMTNVTDNTSGGGYSSCCGGGGGGGSGGGSSIQEPVQSTPQPVAPTTNEQNTQQQTPPQHDAAPETSQQSDDNFFTDIADYWAKNEVIAIKNECNVTGYSDKFSNFLRIFVADKDITRAELLSMIMKCKFGPLSQPEVGPFPDVPANHWAAPYIKKAKELELIHGFSDGTFKPDLVINRAEGLKLILLASFTMSEIESTTSNAECNDVDQTAWYAKYFNFALNNGIINQYKDANGNATGLCHPDYYLTRGQAASYIIKVKRTVVQATPRKVARH